MSYLLANANTSANVWNHLGEINESDILRTTEPTEFQHFGFSVAIDEDTLIVADSEPAYSVYIFTNESGKWKENAVLSDPTASGSPSFGYAVAISGDVLVISAPNVKTVEPYTGTVFVYERSPSNSWQQIATLHGAESLTENVIFGRSVSISGNTIAVTEYPQFYDNSNSGDVYLFERNAGGMNNWGEVAVLRGARISFRGGFGESIALHNNRLVVGAYLDDHDSGSIYSDYGAAYIFERNQGGTSNWGLVAELHASDAQLHDWFGGAVGVHEDAIAVAASIEDGGTDDPIQNSGTVYLFEHDGSDNWNEIAVLRASDGQQGDLFGSSVAINGNRLVVNSELEDGGEGDPALSAGAAYLFERTDTGSWSERAILRASDIQEYDSFGHSVGISENHIIVGSPYEDGGSGDAAFNSGAVYLFGLPYNVTEKLYLPLITD